MILAIHEASFTLKKWHKNGGDGELRFPRKRSPKFLVNFFSRVSRVQAEILTPRITCQYIFKRLSGSSKIFLLLLTQVSVSYLEAAQNTNMQAAK